MDVLISSSYLVDNFFHKKAEPESVPLGLIQVRGSRVVSLCSIHLVRETLSVQLAVCRLGESGSEILRRVMFRIPLCTEVAELWAVEVRGTIQASFACTPVPHVAYNIPHRE